MHCVCNTKKNSDHSYTSFGYTMYGTGIRVDRERVSYGTGCFWITSEWQEWYRLLQKLIYGWLIWERFSRFSKKTFPFQRKHHNERGVKCKFCPLRLGRDTADAADTACPKHTKCKFHFLSYTALLGNIKANFHFPFIGCAAFLPLNYDHLARHFLNSLTFRLYNGKKMSGNRFANLWCQIFLSWDFFAFAF